MKNVRWITLVIVLALAFSVWTPGTVLAKPAQAGAASIQTSVDFAKSTMVKLTLINQTGGILYVSLVSEKMSYSFATGKQGKSIYQILPGKYTFTASTSKCPGSIVKTRSFKGSSTLGPYICRKH
jgi:hypothetical protein